MVDYSFPNSSYTSSIRFENPGMSIKVSTWADQSSDIKRNVYFGLFIRVAFLRYYRSQYCSLALAGWDHCAEVVLMFIFKGECLQW